ncbi:PAS domain-containing sensor histidine kinase [Flavobacterium sp. K77]|uniref:PAS domain-containing sensor histidine kinase n=1 Tax=Flavobacterium sp. K77 TaxID=2910676 RepID=UPI001F4604C6|nr:PAS domain-containing sensor histidine kinase [Flavobacterium sp. K77]MCF6141954.1 PAS domain-containing sensor histidine kinase [Flavobacterium sp. K77]
MTKNKENPDSEGIYHFDNFFKISADFICIAGFDGYFKRINPAVSRTLGYTEAELYARPISSFVHEADLKNTIETREQVYKNKPLLNFENRYLTKSGEIIWLSWTSMPVMEEKLVYAIAKNITHTKKREEERNILLAKLTQINKELTVLSHKTSHDLKSPLNNMLAVFNLIDTSKIDDNETLELINILQETSQNLRNTLNDSLDQLVVNENLHAQIETVNIPETLALVTASIKSLVLNSKATIATDFSAFDEIDFNKGYLQSIFLNLLSNAIKYSKADSSPNIYISTKYNNGIKQLIFSDQGIGFDLEKVKDKVFGLYEKFHDNSDSSGIGLYLVYNHISSLGGNISVNSKTNEGTTFTISFK